MPRAAVALCTVGAALAGAPAELHGAGAVRPPPIRAGEFVRVEGTRFVLGERPFHFVGANVSVMHGTVPRQGLEATLDAAALDRLAVLRVWAFGEAPAGTTEAWRREHAFRFGPDGWIEESFVHLDRVLAAARARDLRVVLVLGNRWSAYGGVPEYLRWAGTPPAEPEVTAEELTRFFRSASCAAAYRAHARRLLERTNTVTGVPYRDDPTIVAWELMNELSAGGAGEAERALTAWVDELAAFIHARDPNHLVGAGHIGYWDRRERRVWTRLHQLASIDYADSHAYPAQEERLRRPRDLARWLDDRLSLAHRVIGKPLVWGEIGVPTDAPRFRGRPRVAWLEAFLAAAFRGATAGVLVWIYEPWSGAPRDYGIYVEDRGPARTGDVRQVLRRWASRVLARPPEARVRSRLAALAAPIFPLPPLDLRGRAAPHDGWRSIQSGAVLELAIDPVAFARARFDHAGVWREGVLDHVWGSGPGVLEYRFRRPPAAPAPARIVVSARLSSELPGDGAGRAPEDTSEVTVELDGLRIARLVAPPDDGAGAEVEVTVTDPAVLRRLARDGVHALRLVAAEEPGAGGLCVYGGATGRFPVPPELAARLPGRVRIVWIPAGDAPSR